MARAALYKWIKSPDQIDLSELDKMIQRYPFAQNLHILKSISVESAENQVIAQAHSLQTSWYQYVIRRELKKEVPSSILRIDDMLTIEEIEDVQPSHVSDAEKMSETVSDEKLIVYDLPWNTDKEEEEIEVDWTSSESIFFDESEDKEVTVETIEEDVVAEDKIAETDAVLPEVSFTETDVELDIVQAYTEPESGLLDSSIESSKIDIPQDIIEEPNEIIKEEASIIVPGEILKIETANASENAGLEKDVSEFVSWLRKQRPVTAPQPENEPIENEIELKEASEKSEQMEESLKSTEVEAPVEVEVKAKKKVKNKAAGNKKSASKKSKKKAKKIKGKRAQKNKKLAQKLRKKKKIAEKLKAKFKKLKKEMKVAATKKKKRAEEKKSKKSEKSIEAILKNKASKNGKKKGKRKLSNGASVDVKSRRKRGKKGGLDLKLASEPLANLLWLQGHSKKAIRMFEHLSLKMPEKKAYFASQIAKLKKKKK